MPYIEFQMKMQNFENFVKVDLINLYDEIGPYINVIL